jgi:integrase
MATFVKRGSSIRAVVRKKGSKPATKSFDNMKEAKAWAAQEEFNVEKRVKISGGMTLGQILTKFRDEIVMKRAYQKKKHYHLTMLAEQHAKVELAEMTSQWWLDTVSAMDVSPGSAMKYIGHMTSALKTAEAMWEITPDWKSYEGAMATLDKLGKIGQGNARDRRLMSGELEQIKKILLSHMPMSDLIDFAIGTCMRVGEITALTWADYDKAHKMVWVRNRKDPRKKMGNDMQVPLLGNMCEIIDRQPRTHIDRHTGMAGVSKRIFPYIPDVVSKCFQRACGRAGIVGLTFHDLRHEGITRLFEQGYGIPEVALVSGHKNWANLKRYVALKSNSLHKGPIALQRKAA